MSRNPKTLGFRACLLFNVLMCTYIFDLKVTVYIICTVHYSRILLPAIGITECVCCKTVNCYPLTHFVTRGDRMRVLSNRKLLSINTFCNWGNSLRWGNTLRFHIALS